MVGAWIIVMRCIVGSSALEGSRLERGSKEKRQRIGVSAGSQELGLPQRSFERSVMGRGHRHQRQS
jgi:hypothetical protein